MVTGLCNSGSKYHELPFQPDLLPFMELHIQLEIRTRRHFILVANQRRFTLERAHEMRRANVRLDSLYIIYPMLLPDTNHRRRT